jgi:hypothetical protein
MPSSLLVGALFCGTDLHDPRPTTYYTVLILSLQLTIDKYITHSSIYVRWGPTFLRSPVNWYHRNTFQKLVIKGYLRLSEWIQSSVRKIVSEPNLRRAIRLFYAFLIVKYLLYESLLCVVSTYCCILKCCRTIHSWIGVL